MAKISQGSRIFLATGLLSGGIIGAGVFALPFVMRQSGLVMGLGYLALAGIAYTLIHLMYAEVILNTKGEHRFVGYIEKYLGRSYRFFSIWIAVVQMVFVLTIYLVLSRSFLLLLLPNISEIVLLFFFWILGSGAIFLNLKRIAASETLVALAMIAIIGLIFFFGISQEGALSTTPLIGRGALWLLPLPAILFALSGRVGIPALVRSFSDAEPMRRVKGVKLATILGTLIPAVVYALFVIGALSLTALPSEDAVSALIAVLPQGLILLLGLLGIFSLWSSYLLVGFDVDATLKYDLSFTPSTRFLIVILAPLILYLAGFTSFLVLVSFVGGIFLVVEAFFILKMWGALWKSAPEVKLFSHYSKAISICTGLLFILALAGLCIELWG